jgi:N-acetylmuramoyl-L-alanine amidase CwlA
MAKKLYIFFIFNFLFILSSTSVDASLLVLQKGGALEWKVLSASDENTLNIPKLQSLEVNRVGEVSPSNESIILLAKANEKFNLTVSADDTRKELDITGWKEDIVEIEERPEVQRVRISVQNGKFNLKQKGISAITEDQVTIDSKSAELSIKTASGNKFLSVLPYDAVQSVLKTKVITEISDYNIQILEENGTLAYKIAGNKVINFFNFYFYKIPVDSFVSASTGAILKIDSPTFYKYLNFWFV